MPKISQKRKDKSYELKTDAVGNRSHGVVCEVRTLKILLNSSLEHGGDRTDVGE